MKLVYLNYKDPLSEVENGYGYVGALAQTEEGDKVQCHICGELFYNLGAHIFNTHNMKSRDYREKFGLGLRTPLCSDKASEDYKQRALKIYNSLSESERQAKKEQMAEVGRNAPKRPRTLTAEELNRKGICPDQLIDKIQVCAAALGHTPSKIEFDKYYSTERFFQPIIRTFGSWSNALKTAGYLPKRARTGGTMPRYTDEDLLRLMKEYAERTKRTPTAVDCHRGYLPSFKVYQKRFGSIKKARLLAGID